MISIGIDVSKGKSTICILKPYGELVKKPFIVQHTKESLDELTLYLNNMKGEKRIFVEAVFCKNFFIKVASNFSIVLHLRFP